MGERGEGRRVKATLQVISGFMAMMLRCDCETRFVIEIKLNNNN